MDMPTVVLKHFFGKFSERTLLKTGVPNTVSSIGLRETFLLEKLNCF